VSTGRCARTKPPSSPLHRRCSCSPTEKEVKNPPVEPRRSAAEASVANERDPSPQSTSRGRGLAPADPTARTHPPTQYTHHPRERAASPGPATRDAAYSPGRGRSARGVDLKQPPHRLSPSRTAFDFLFVSLVQSTVRWFAGREKHCWPSPVFPCARPSPDFRSLRSRTPGGFLRPRCSLAPSLRRRLRRRG